MSTLTESQDGTNGTLQGIILLARDDLTFGPLWVFSFLNYDCMDSPTQQFMKNSLIAISEKLSATQATL